MYAARLRPPRHQSRRWISSVKWLLAPSQFVQRKIPSSSRPAQQKRELPVQIGGHVATMNFVPVLFPPHRKIAKTKLNARPVFVVLTDMREIVIESRRRSIPIARSTHTASRLTPSRYTLPFH